MAVAEWRGHLDKSNKDMVVFVYPLKAINPLAQARYEARYLHLVVI